MSEAMNYVEAAEQIKQIRSAISGGQAHDSARLACDLAIAALTGEDELEAHRAKCLDALKIYIRERAVPRRRAEREGGLLEAWPLEAAREGLVRVGEEWLRAESAKAAR